MPLIVFMMLLSFQPSCSQEELKRKIRKVLDKEKGTFAVAFKDMQTEDVLLLNEHEIFHAASTMKTPVMIEVFKQAFAGKFSLTDSMLIKNQFQSIVDDSPYALNSGDDSDSSLYQRLGDKETIANLVRDMIVVSSNLATNLVIERVGAKNVTATMRSLGANDIQVLRGVEDSKAFEKNLNNVTSAHDLMLLFEMIGREEMVNEAASKAMTKILLDQHFNQIIPRHLPQGVEVAHKTGNITGVRHDGGIVLLPDGRKYVLVLLSKNLEDEDKGMAAMAEVSKLVYEHAVVSGKQ
jgi:beta-lactamase class A